MLLLGLLGVFLGTSAQTSEYIECRPGDLNVILGAPHGGDERPSSIRDRDAGCYIQGECVFNHGCGDKSSSQCGVVTSKDLYTLELTNLIADELEARTGQRPTTSINLLHRIKLDANRDINEATFGEADSVEAWEAFNACINASKIEIESRNGGTGRGMFFDIHGHGHPNVWAEMGYLLTGSNLDNGNFDPEDTSIFYGSTQTDADFEEYLRGETSFGGYLQSRGYDSVPGPEFNSPEGESYFSGGYNTRIHGSRDGGRIDAIQIESARAHRNPPGNEQYAEAIALSIIDFMEEHGYNE